MSETLSPSEPGSVRRRHIVYVQGYDPRGLAEYYRMFRGDYRRFLALYGLTGTIGKARHDDADHTTTWPIDTRGNGWHVDTTYEFLRWDDIIREDFARSRRWKIVHALATLMHRLIWQGTLFKVARTNWRFAIFIFYPYLVLLAHMIVAVIGGALVRAILAAIGLPEPLALTAGFVVFAGALIALIVKTEPLSYMLYMFDDISSHNQYAHRRRPDWEARFDAFAVRLCEVAATTDADEIVVIGHSSGSFVAVDVLGRAFARDPQLGRHGARLRLLTVGANLPVIGFNPDAGWFRDRIAQLALAPDLVWVDFQSRKDVMNFFAFDPVTGHGLDVGAARRNPVIVPVRFRDIIAPENYPAFRWRFFDVHFQFLRANQRRGAAYDYFMICCGPVDLATRALEPQRALAATGEPAPGA